VRQVIERPEGDCFLVMDFLGGGSLAELVGRGPLSAERAATIMHSVAEAVDFAHQHGILHRDLKLQNILLDKAGQPYVLDFGLALEESRQWSEKVWGGTQGFMPVESLLKMTGQLDGRSDVWGLGAVLYELLTKKPLSRPQTKEEALIEAVLAPQLLDFPHEVPAALQAICSRCLARQPHERFNTAGELATNLEFFLASGDQKVSCSKEESLVKVRAWRMGIKLGVATKCHARFQALLRGPGTTGGQLQSALFFETNAMLSLEECASVGRELGIPVDLPEKHQEYRKWFYKPLKGAVDICQLREEAREVQEHLNSLYQKVCSELNEKGEPPSLVFRLGVTAVLCQVSRQAREEIPQKAASTDLPPGVYADFLKKVEAGFPEDFFEEEFSRLDRAVERWYMYGEAFGRKK
jgi:hypothetical protein